MFNSKKRKRAKKIKEAAHVTTVVMCEGAQIALDTVTSTSPVGRIAKPIARRVLNDPNVRKEIEKHTEKVFTVVCDQAEITAEMIDTTAEKIIDTGRQFKDKTVQALPNVGGKKK